MITNLFFAIITGILNYISRFLIKESLSTEVIDLLNQMIAGARVFGDYIPVTFLFKTFAFILGIEISWFILNQVFNVMNWIRGSGELKGGL